MTPKQASPLIAADDKREVEIVNGITVTLHSQKRLQYLTKAAVDKACKLHGESRRFVHIVDTQSCGSSKVHGLSNPFSSLSSALMKKLSTASPSPSRQWALSKGSDDRRAVAARIHSLLLEWKADSSFQWRARVACAVPVLEEAFYKGAKSKEEYTNPQLLETQLIQVLCHFEAGNGPFLLQGSTPLYSVRACSPSTVASVRMSFFHQSPLSHGLPTNGEISELASSAQTCERARPSCSRSSASVVNSNSIAVGSNVQDAANICWVDAMEVRPSNHRVFPSNGLVKKIANMLAKKRRDSGVCVTQELGSAHAGLERAGDLAEDGTSDGLLPYCASSCSTDERRTLGGILKLNNLTDSTTQEVLTIDAEEASIARSRADQGAGSAEAPSLSSNMPTEATRKVVCKFPVGCSDPQFNVDSRTSEEEITPFRVSNDEGSSASVAQGVLTNELLAHQKQGAHCGQGSFLSFISSSSFTPVSSSSSASPPSSSSTPSLADVASIEHQHPQPVAAGELGDHNAQRSSPGARPRVIESPLASSNDTSSKTIERGLKLPLRRFLAEREEFKGGVSTYVDRGCPWETWEEATEQLDGMCCVCMVGLKGAAFIPCGHTFCRKCSRELWRGRGTCPLCNSYIREILDIY